MKDYEKQRMYLSLVILAVVLICVVGGGIFAAIGIANVVRGS